MADAKPVTIAGPGPRLYGGLFAAAVLTGGLVAGDAVASGELSNVPEPPTTGITATKLRGGSAGLKYFALFQAFKKGDVPSGQTLAGLQMTVRNRWPDGSVKLALLAGAAVITAATDRPVGMALGAAVSGSNLTLTHLQAAAPVAVFGCGAFGTVTLSGSALASPFDQVAAGPLMSSWRYRMPVGSDPHLVAWAEVRLFADGSVAILPWHENGYLTGSAHTNKSAIFTFTLNGTLRYTSGSALDMKHHQKITLISGGAIEHWTGSDPGIWPIHDQDYLESTELLPAYYGAMAAGSAEVTELPTTFTPLAQGVYNYGSDSMGSTGFQEPIGLLPQHDGIVMTAHDTDRVTAVRAAVQAGYSAGRYGIHFRDATTNGIPRLTDYPTLVLRDSAGLKDTGASTTSTYSPAVTGGNAPQWDPAHCPAVGYMAYLLTGHVYHLDTVLFAHVANHFNVTDWARGAGRGNVVGYPVYAPLAGYTGASGVCTSKVQTRTDAWWFRSLIQALTVVPDADASGVRADLIASVQANCLYYSTYYNNTVNNPFGITEPAGGEDYGDPYGRVSMFQQDFVTAVWGWALSLDLPISSTAKTQMGNFFAWKAQSVVYRLGLSSDFWYINAGTYTLRISSSALQPINYFEGTGPWAANWAAVYALTMTANTAWAGSTEGVLAGEFFPETGAGLIPAMWNNMQPAISYAVRHGVSGASAAYARIKAASNWSALAAGFSLRPGWGMKPLLDPVATPTWLLGVPLLQWADMGAASALSGAPLNAWGTLVPIDGTGTLVSAANGGHTDSSDNRVTSIDITQNAPAWTPRIAPSPSVTIDAPYMPDGKPVSRHGYHHAHYIAQRGRVMLFAAEGINESGGWAGKVDGVRVSDWTWDCVTGAATYPPLEPFGRGYGIARDPRTGNVWTAAGWLWDCAANAWSQPVTQQLSSSYVRNPFPFDTLRNQFFTMQWADGRGYSESIGFLAKVLHPTTGVLTTITFSAGSAAALAQLLADKPAYMGGDYDTVNDNYVFYPSQSFASGVVLLPNRLYRVTPNNTNVWDMDLMTVAGTPDTTPSGGAGINGRFRYINTAVFKGFVMFPRQDARGWAFRTSN